MSTAIHAATTPEPGTQTFVIDSDHSDVGFSVRHMLSRTRGRFARFSGQIQLDREQPERSSIVFEVDPASIDTRQPDRDAHLKSGDFFDAEQYPTITFASTAVRERPDNTWEVDGNLTVHDVTRPVQLQVDFDGGGPSPFGDQRIGFSAATDVNREDFGLTYNMVLESGGVLVGKTARIELSVQAVAAAQSVAA